MILSSAFCVILVIVNAVICTEGTSVSRSFSSVIIQFNNTVCKVQDGVLSINDKVIGHLTEEQKEELEKYTNRTEQWSNQLYQQMQKFFESVFGSMKNIWENAWNSHSQLSPQSSKPDNIITENKSGDQEDDVPSLFNVLEPPSFCKVN
ncbi:filarial antigen Av33 [Loa loa]|uniref:Filarial antigen Av33 n=1 Tax=Loa loa TaxID=7209 RepID=A0A1I7VYJ2_LOALO|nr:filarial antigen Av33 [Loa loa]EFO16121.1 filarial antigen Av33 [Loa loa]